MRDCRRAVSRQNANRDRGARSLRTRDVQQSRANQTTGRSLEKNVQRSKRRNGRSDDGRGRFLRIQLAPGTFHSSGQFSCRRGGTGKISRIKKARCGATSNPAFEQVRTRAGTDYSNWGCGNDGSGAGFDEEIATWSSRAKVEGSRCDTFKVALRDLSASLGIVGYLTSRACSA